MPGVREGLGAQRGGDPVTYRAQQAAVVLTVVLAAVLVKDIVWMVRQLGEALR